MGFLCLFVAGGDSGTNGPHRLVGDNNPAHLISRYSRQSFFDLGCEDIQHLVAFTFLQGFANAEDGTKAGVERGTDFLIDELIGFVQ